MQSKECFMQIVNVDIEINNHEIITRRQENNFYFFNLFNVSKSILILTAINRKIIKMWHVRLNHFEKQNLIKFAQMSQNMNFSKFLFFDVYVLCVIGQTQMTFYKIFIKLKKHFLNLIHSDVRKFFLKISNDVKYWITFHCDLDKQSHVSFFVSKKKCFKHFSIIKTK